MKKDPLFVKDLVDEFLSKKEYLTPSTLCAIMTSFGSDKGDERHNYTTLYSKLFTPWKDEALQIFELGVGTNFTDIPSNMGPEGKPGASHYGWALFFPHAHIYGADIDKRILFQTDTIKTFYCDQNNENSIQQLFQNKDLINISFDIMIEDGLHVFDANLKFLTHSIQKLKPGGIYITEDLNAEAREGFLHILPQFKKKFHLSYGEVINIPYHLNKYDNSLLILQKDISK